MEPSSCHYRWDRMLFRLPACVLLCFELLFSGPVFASSIFINEFHYDNTGGDTGEGVEIAGPAGLDLTNWSLSFYNGANGEEYKSRTLAGIIPDQQNGFGTLTFMLAGIQNGPDGVALVDPTATVVQFLSYEGGVTAIEGPAAGMTGTDIGIYQHSSTPTGLSLQLTGSGAEYGDFSWVLADASFGLLNDAQNFVAQTAQQPPVPTPEPGTLLLFAVGGMSLLPLRKTLKR